MEKPYQLKKLLFFVSEDWYFHSHRLPLASAALEKGFEVLLVTRVNRHKEIIEKQGIRVIPLTLKRRGKNPFQEIKTILSLINIYLKEKPDITHHVAIKPVIYGSIAAKIARIPAVVNALTGLGYVFTSNDLKARIMRPIVEIAYRNLLNGPKTKVIFQNNDDLGELERANVLSRKQAVIIRGSGVNTTVFHPTPEPPGPPIVMVASRLLIDKGILEFVAAASQLHLEGIKARFVLVGDTDSANPSMISREQVETWNAEGVIEWWGWRDKMEKILPQAHIVCLPSYREGLPKVLLEAASCGRPLVATDVPGCREIVIHGENGLLVEVKDAVSLAHALRSLVTDAEKRMRMGKRSREIVISEFTQEQVASKTLELYQNMLG